VAAPAAGAGAGVCVASLLSDTCPGTPSHSDKRVTICGIPNATIVAD